MDQEIKLSTFQPTNLSIPYTALEDLLKFFSNKLVGKVCKRIEISPNTEILKSQTKELIYEQTRDLFDLILALNFGMEIQVFNIQKSKESK